MPTLHVGTSRAQTITGSDGSTPAAVGVSASPLGVVSLSVAGNVVTVSGVGAGSTNVVYTSPGYQDAMQTFTVAPLPALVVTDGPEV
jgi:hypothetical protein